MMKPHNTRKDLAVDDWAIAEYNRRPKDESAQLLMRVNFDKDWSGLLMFIVFIENFPCSTIEWSEQVCNRLVCIFAPMPFTKMPPSSSAGYAKFKGKVPGGAGDSRQKTINPANGD